MRVRKCPERGRGGASQVQFAGLPRPVLLRINGKLPAMKAIRFASLLVILFATASTQAQTTQPAPLTTVDVWPAGKMPGKGSERPEGEWTGRKPDGFHRITDVSRPTLAVFPVPRAPGAAAAPAMIVCPGGGYSYVVIDKEGTDIAAW